MGDVDEEDVGHSSMRTSVPHGRPCHPRTDHDDIRHHDSLQHRPVCHGNCGVGALYVDRQRCAVPRRFGSVTGAKVDGNGGVVAEADAVVVDGLRATHLDVGSERGRGADVVDEVV